MEWRPIKSAPRDTILIVYGAAGHRFGRLDLHGQWRNMMWRPMNTVPTHWMPLPAPPAEKSC